jgi:coproporphyrinogen III oxidase
MKGKNKMTNLITHLPNDTVKDLERIASGWIDEYQFISKIIQASYDEPMTAEDREYQLYDEGESLFISHLTGLNLTLNNPKILAWIKNCQDKFLEAVKKFEGSKLEIDGLNASYWKRKKNQAEVQHAKTQVLFNKMVKEAPANWSKSFGSNQDKKKILSESAHTDFMKYLNK